MAGDARPSARVARAARAVRETRSRPELVRALRAALEVLPDGFGDRGTVEATVLFTELCGFSSWVLEAGDELALELLRGVASVVEPAITTHRGRVVKRLGDGHMAVFPQPRFGVDAALGMQEGVSGLEVGGYRPRLRVGLHTGQPRQLGGDYLGTDVNIAARVSEAAAPGEVLVSGPALIALGEERGVELEVKRRRGFRAKGTPTGLEVYAVSRRGS